MKEIQVRDKAFRVYIDAKDIHSEITRVAEELKEVYGDRNPIFIGVLNGAFMFLSDLMKQYNDPAEIAFLKASSYRGMESTGQVSFSEIEQLNIKGRDVVIVEDIVDTGNTLESLHAHLSSMEPSSLVICTLLFKEEAYQKSLPIDYVCFRTENAFLLGYGLDYDGHGRNLPDIYILSR